MNMKGSISFFLILNTDLRIDFYTLSSALRGSYLSWRNTLCKFFVCFFFIMSSLFYFKWTLALLPQSSKRKCVLLIYTNFFFFSATCCIFCWINQACFIPSPEICYAIPLVFFIGKSVYTSWAFCLKRIHTF